jgi:hypothetical protein
MKAIRYIVAAALLAGTTLSAAAATQLTHWPAETAAKLNSMIKQHAHRGDYAVFDADNTSYRYDLEESLLPYLEKRGVLTREKLDPSLKLIPFKDSAEFKENLNSYYYRLCEVDDLVCYPWVAQVFSGFTLKELKGYLDDMLAEAKPVPIKYWSGEKVVEGTVNPPKFYTGMQELYNALRENGIQVYVISAAHEELVRMVLADPKYGYNIEPQNVIGVNTLLKNPATGELTTSRLAIKAGKYDPKQNRDWQITPYLMNPMTWYEGKLGTIHGWIDQWRKPVLVAGDTPISDGYMLQHSADIARGGMRIWVNRKAKYMTQMENWWGKSAAQQKELGQTVDADKGWLVVKPEDIQ